MEITTLSRHSAQAILDNVMSKQENVTNCHVCDAKIVGTVFTICAPVRDSANVTLKGHSACSKCVQNNDYIGVHGKCSGCLRQFRSNSGKCGLALIPPCEGKMTTEVVGILRDAEKEINKLRENEEKQRIEEGERRRAIAVEEVRRKKQMEEEARDILERAKREAEENVERMMKEAEENAEIEARKRMEQIEKEAITEAKKKLETSQNAQEKPKRKYTMSEETKAKRQQTMMKRAHMINTYAEKKRNADNMRNLVKRLLNNPATKSMIESMMNEDELEFVMSPEEDDDDNAELKEEAVCDI
jgi:hypothetical protein